MHQQRILLKGFEVYQVRAWQARGRSKHSLTLARSQGGMDRLYVASQALRLEAWVSQRQWVQILEACQESMAQVEEEGLASWEKALLLAEHQAGKEKVCLPMDCDIHSRVLDLQIYHTNCSTLKNFPTAPQMVVA